MSHHQYIEYECTPMSFQPLQRHAVRWLEWEQDYPLVQDFWPEQTPAGWQEAREEGFQYCAVVEHSQLQALGGGLAIFGGCVGSGQRLHAAGSTRAWVCPSCRFVCHSRNPECWEASHV